MGCYSPSTLSHDELSPVHIEGHLPLSTDPAIPFLHRLLNRQSEQVRQEGVPLSPEGLVLREVVGRPLFGNPNEDEDEDEDEDEERPMLPSELRAMVLAARAAQGYPVPTLVSISTDEENDGNRSTPPRVRNMLGIQSARSRLGAIQINPRERVLPEFIRELAVPSTAVRRGQRAPAPVPNRNDDVDETQAGRPAQSLRAFGLNPREQNQRAFPNRQGIRNDDAMVSNLGRRLREQEEANLQIRTDQLHDYDAMAAHLQRRFREQDEANSHISVLEPRQHRDSDSSGSILRLTVTRHSNPE